MSYSYLELCAQSKLSLGSEETVVVALFPFLVLSTKHSQEQWGQASHGQANMMVQYIWETPQATNQVLIQDLCWLLT